MNKYAQYYIHQYNDAIQKIHTHHNDNSNKNSTLLTKTSGLEGILNATKNVANTVRNVASNTKNVAINASNAIGGEGRFIGSEARSALQTPFHGVNTGVNINNTNTYVADGQGGHGTGHAGGFDAFRGKARHIADTAAMNGTTAVTAAKAPATIMNATSAVANKVTPAVAKVAPTIANVAPKAGNILNGATGMAKNTFGAVQRGATALSKVPGVNLLETKAVPLLTAGVMANDAYSFVKDPEGVRDEVAGSLNNEYTLGNMAENALYGVGSPVKAIGALGKETYDLADMQLHIAQQKKNIAAQNERLNPSAPAPSQQISPSVTPTPLPRPQNKPSLF